VFQIIEEMDSRTAVHGPADTETRMLAEKHTSCRIIAPADNDGLPNDDRSMIG